ncbi:hypothetical protein, partial [Peribacillus simplex]|uniref:hypothetical protein n=1 Tax=Peribacillus simplex TaxID=1478 RepID=UPI000BD2CCE1
LKKFATLLPNNWLAETPQTLARGGLADSWRKGSGFLISREILLRKKTQGNAILRTYLKQDKSNLHVFLL